MPKSHYFQALRELHVELEKTKETHSNAPEHTEKLQTLSQNVQDVLEHPGEAPFENHFRLMSSLKDGVLHFEASHPTLTALMNNVITMLNNIGIK